MPKIEEVFILTDADKARIQKFLPALETALGSVFQEFYSWLQSDPKVKSVIEQSPHTTDELANFQKNHWVSLLKKGPDEDFYERARRIGEVHARIGVTPTWYIAAYTFIQQRLQIVLGQKSRLSGAKAAELIGTLSKVIMFDMQAALSVYTASEEDQTKQQTGSTISDEILDSSIEVSIATNESSMATMKMLQGMRLIDERAQTISAAVEETVTGIQQISETTKVVAEIAQQADSRATDGESVVNEATSRMDEITRVVESTSSLVNELSDSSREISEIVKTIDDIASQTNLLALNATIEAARAGEAGKGFAVVASEVKSLSTQTAQATERIGNRIEALLAEMGRIVRSMEEANAAVTYGQESMTQMSGTMSELRTNVADVSSRMDQVSMILREQSEASNEVAEGVSSIASESAQSVESLDSLADSMRSVESQIGRQLNQLSQYEVPNRVLRIAKSDHVIWKKRLADMLAGREALRADELADHSKCRLGKFYYGPEAEFYKTLPSFRALEEPHKEVHKWGIEATKRFNAGDTDGAVQAIELVEKASVKVLEFLDKTITEAKEKRGD